MSIIVKVTFLFLFHIIDFLSAFAALVILYLVNKYRMKELSQSESEYYINRDTTAERNVAANTATRTIQAGITIGGFLFAGLFASFFQSDLAMQPVHVVIALSWTAFSLFFGLVNMINVPVPMLTKNFVASPAFSNLLLLQSLSLLGAFIRLTILFIKDLFPNFGV
jgi:cellulose synthase/poly-beta-1,6-N-acetylglucosamine synthase-like glycosyltransferase